MKTIAIAIEEKVDALLACLDKDIQLLQKGLSRLDELRGLVIRRDDDALGKLLETIQVEANDRQRHEQSRQSTRRELAMALRYEPRQMTLTALETLLPKDKKDQITERKAEIQSLVMKFRKEHLKTVLLLSECARFNNLLLKSIFNLGKVESFSYNKNGSTKRQTDVTLINFQL
ncbi:MAG: hypothetical protein JXM79_12460 [Sedimentisphaerales bacterium]|nr:hypothetical protein [Sedimentisphaerales bacterium]